MGDAVGGVAGVEEFSVAPAISLEGYVRGVEGAAVGLDDEAVVRPEEVDLDAAFGDRDGGVEERGRDIAREEQRQDLCLEWALESAFLGDGSSAPPFVRKGPQRFHPPPPRVHRRLDRRDVENLPLRRPLEAAPQRPVADGACEVDEGPSRARARDAVNSPPLAPPRRPHAVEPDPVDFATAGWRGDDVDHHRPLIEKSQERSSAAVGDDGSGAGEGCSSQTPMRTDVSMSQRVRAAEDAM